MKNEPYQLHRASDEGKPLCSPNQYNHQLLILHIQVSRVVGKMTEAFRIKVTFNHHSIHRVPTTSGPDQELHPRQLAAYRDPYRYLHDCNQSLWKLGPLLSKVILQPIQHFVGHNLNRLFLHEVLADNPGFTGGYRGGTTVLSYSKRNVWIFVAAIIPLTAAFKSPPVAFLKPTGIDNPDAI